MDSAAVEGEGNPVLYRGAAATFVDAIKSVLSCGGLPMF